MSVRLCTSEEYYHLVVSTDIYVGDRSGSGTSSTFVFAIDKSHGSFFYSGTPQVDLFESEEAARDSLQRRYSTTEWEELGVALVGAIRQSGKLVICAVKEQKTVAYVLGRPVNQIVKVFYKEIDFAPSPDPKSKDFWNEFPLEAKHYYCRGVDLSDKFPYLTKQQNIYESEFCWNRRWILSFRGLHASHACIAVLQGVAFSMDTENEHSERNVTYILKRSAANPGARFIARGTNEHGDPANECECELIFTNKDEVTGCVWRRGSIPLKWGSKLPHPWAVVQNFLLDDPEEFTTPYFTRLSLRFDNQISIVIASLLSNGTDKEAPLTEAYRSAVSSLSTLGVKFHTFDLNKAMRELGTHSARQQLLSELYEDIRDSKFTVVTGGSTIQSTQNILLRFNCADSLDRTNVATFYYALWVVEEYARATKEFQNDDGSGPAQDVVDFVGSAILEGGKVVGLMYTNTEALKEQCISQFLSGKPRWSSDTWISAKRRFFNVLTDRDRDKMLRKWTKVRKPDNPIHMLESHNLSVCPVGDDKQSIGHQLVEDEIQGFWIYPGRVQEDVFLLPDSLAIAGIRLFLIPHRNNHSILLTLSCGSQRSEMFPICLKMALPNVSEPQWVQYRITELTESSNQIPYDFRSAVDVHFVSVKFESSNPNECFLVGNVKFEVMKCKEGHFFAVEPAQESRSRFELLSETTKKPSTAELVRLELMTLTSGILPAVKNKELVEKGLSPFLFDMCARLVATNDSKCPLCDKTLPKDPEWFVWNRQYRAFVHHVPKERRSQISPDEGIIKLCDECAWIMNQSTGVNTLNPSNSMLRKVHSGIEQPKERRHCYQGGSVKAFPFCFLWDASDCVSRSGLNRLISPLGDGLPQEVTLDSDDDVYFTLCFTCSMVFSKVEVIMNKDVEVQCHLVCSNGETIECQREGIAVRASLTNVTDSIKFVWHGTDGVHFAIKQIALIGEPRERLLATPSQSDFLICGPARDATPKTQWKPEERRQSIVNLQGPVSSITLKVLKDDTTRASLIIACYENDKCVYYLPIVVPIVTHETRFVYPITNVEDWRHARIDIFYLDRVARQQPYEVTVR